MVLQYEFGWADDPCDITTRIVESLPIKTILQVIGSGDHLLSFLSAPQITRVVGFDIDERAIALCDLKLQGIKHLDYDTFVKFFNISRFREYIAGDHNHPILNPNNLLDKDQFKKIYTQISASIKPESKKILDENILFDTTPGYHCINTFRTGAKLSNPSVLPWLNPKRYALIRQKTSAVELHKASLDRFYGIFIGDVVKDEHFDLIWPIDALDNNVNIREFVNLCLSNNSVGGYVMMHWGIKDPYIAVKEAFPDIMNTPNLEYKQKRDSRQNKPFYVVSIEDLFKEVSYVIEEEILSAIEEEYFPRVENTWWDLDIQEAWSPENFQGVKSIFLLCKRKKEKQPLSAKEFLSLIGSLPKYFRRALLVSTDIKEGGDEN